MAATPQLIVVTDFADGSEEALATTLLVRSLLDDGTGRVVTPLAIGRAGGHASGRALLARLSARYLLSGEVRRSSDGLRALFALEDDSGARLAESSVASAPGDVLDLATRVARAVAPDLKLTVNAEAHAALGELRPYARAASALTRGDGKAAAAALASARPEVARAVSGARDVAAAVFADSSQPLSARLRAGRLAGLHDAALALFQAAHHPDTAARAEQVRLLLAAGEAERAASALDKLRATRSPELVVPRAELLLARRGAEAGGEISELVRPLLERRDPDVQAAVFALRLPPRFLDSRTEAAVLEAARHVAPEQPDLAGELALRAARGGPLPPSAVAMVRVDDLSAADLAVVGGAARAVPQAGPALEGKIANRLAIAERLGRPVDGHAGLTARPTALGKPAPGPARVGDAVPVQLGEERPVEPPPITLPPELSTVEATRAGRALAPLLSAFPRLAERRGRTVLLLQREGTWSSLARSHEPVEWRILLGLRQALSSPPYSLRALAPAEPPLPSLSPAALRERAARTDPPSDLVLAWFADADGDKAIVHLTLFDARLGDALEQAAELDDPSGSLTRWNRSLLSMVGAVLGGVLVLWFLAFALTGSVEVRLTADPGVDRQTLAVRLSRRPERPTIEPLEFERRNEGRRVRGLRLQFGVEDRALFRLVTPGRWFVHLYGVQVRGGQPRALADTFSKSLAVRAGRGSLCTFDLRVSTAECLVTVLDGKPRPDTPVWAGDDRSRAVNTDAHGVAVLTLPLGKHLIRAWAGDIVAEKRVSVPNSRSLRLTIDAGFERRVANIEIPSEESVSAIIHPGRASFAPWPSVAAADDPLPDVTVDMPSPPAMETLLQTVDVSSAPRSADAVRPRSQPPPARQRESRGVELARIVPVPRAMSAATSIAPQRAIGSNRYRLLLELGRGAMGVVYRARDTVLDRDVALKVVSDEGRRHAQALQMFLQEAKAMAALNHPNLITVFDQGQDGVEAFMVMELIEGQTLEQVLERRGKLPVRDVIAIMQQACSGLSYAHERRILHRDLKPANIFLSQRGLVKIGDFGLARAVEKLAITQTKVCGSPAYMAPEQIRGSDLDFRSDLYALGCTMFEMLTGHVPFEEGEPMFHHMYTAPPDPASLEPELPRALCRVVLWCLEKDKEQRPASASVLAQALRDLKLS